MQSSKAQFYLDQCVQAAEKSTMSFTLGAVLVKGGKIIARGHNHQRLVPLYLTRLPSLIVVYLTERTMMGVASS